MKALPVALRSFFLIATIIELRGVYHFLGDGIWSFGNVVSFLFSLVLAILYAFFAWKFEAVMPARARAVQAVVFITCLQTFTVIYDTSMGLSGTHILSGLRASQLIVNSFVAAAFYLGVIILIEQLVRAQSAQPSAGVQL